MATDADGGRRRKATLVCGALAVGLLAVLLFCFADPVPDSDLFWHLAYARQMLEHGTLHLDHTAFSWTPASNRTIYCAWLSELALYGLWQNAGLWSLFALRYLVIAGVLALTWDLARRLGWARRPVTYFVLLVALLAENAGTLLKPELFSLLWFNLVVYAYFRARLARRAGKPAGPWFYAVPAIMVVWVNSHGGFMLAVPFLLATALGESLRRNAEALRGREWRSFLLGWGLCLPATFCNPYGWPYPWQLFEDYVLGRTPRPDMLWNAAHRSVWAVRGAGLDMLEVGLIMAALLAAAFIFHARSRRRADFDFALLLANLASLPLFLIYLRSSWYWAPVWAGSFFFLAENVEFKMPVLPRRWQTVAASLAFVLLGGQAAWSAWWNRPPNTWAGFGISTWNPVTEAEFLAASHLRPRLINLFNTGGYLLWRLSPRYQVMTDSRSFPYLAWYDEQTRFRRGLDFEEFLAAHPGDVAVIDFVEEPVWRQFVRARGWHLVYYGPVAAVFVRDGVTEAQLAAGLAPNRFDRLPSADVAQRVFQFAVAVGDFPTAWKAETQLATRLRSHADRRQRESAERYRAAHQALRKGDYATAASLFHSTLDTQPVSDHDRLIQTLLAEREAALGQGNPDQAGVFEKALARLAAPE